MDADGVDRARWDAAHAAAQTPTLSRIKRQTLCAALPAGVEPTTLWPAWPLEHVAGALALAPGQTLVDLGCGRGETGRWIARHLGVDWVGVDPSAVGRRFAAATEPAGAAAGRDRVVEGHFLASGLPDACADAVLVLDALHFATDLRGTFAEIRRVLRPGGRLVLVGPQQVDPRPHLLDGGWVVERDEQTPDWRATMARFLAAVHAEAPALRAELGEPVATRLLTLDLAALDGVGHGLIVARP